MMTFMPTDAEESLKKASTLAENTAAPERRRRKVGQS
jgi:hypothetical protein